LINQRRLRLSKLVQKSFRRKVVRKRFIRYSLVAANVVVLGVVIAFVVANSHKNQTGAVGVLADTNAAAAKPVDGLTAYDIAANVARIANLPESTPIANQAQSAHVAVAVSASDTNIVAKPQIVATALKSREDIKTYTAQPGDSVSSIAQKFDVTSDSIKWSNGLRSDSVTLGSRLAIPPINGVVYTVKAGDTIQSLATTYKANVDQITAANDAEIAGIYPGEQILIPGGQIQAVAAVSSYNVYGGSFTPLYGSSAGSYCAKWVGRYPCLYGNNGYDYGWCTWYVASRISMPSNWGNASTWAYYASQSGWTVSKTPRVGAIVQTARGDHVGYVEQASADGSQIIYSDMNGLAGWGNVGISGWSPASLFEGRYSDVMYLYH